MPDKNFLKRPDACVILPTYCEVENIKSLIQEIQELKLNLLITVIGDSSPDGTAEIVKKLQEKYDNVFLIVRPEKLGLGTAIITAFHLVLSLKNQPDYIITMDATSLPVENTKILIRQGLAEKVEAN